MPMSHVTTNVRAAALRAEFQNESGEVKSSFLIKESVRGTDSGFLGTTGPTRVPHSSSTAKTSSGKLPYETAGVVYNTLTTTYSSSNAPTKTVPTTALSNVSYSSLIGTANVPHAGTANFNSNSQIIGDDSNTYNSKYHQGVGAFKPGQAVQNYQSGMGSSDANSNLPKYAMAHGQRAPNNNNYIDLLTHAAPGDIMWSMAVTSSGQQPYSPTNGTMNPAWSTTSQNTSATSLYTFGQELFDGHDRWSIVHVKICSGGERYCYHRLNYTSGNYAHICGLIRSPIALTSAYGRQAFASTFASSDYEHKEITMGQIYGGGEICIFADLTPYAASIFNNTSGTDNSTSRYHGSTAGGTTKYAVAVGQYQEGFSSGLKGGYTLTSSRKLTIRGSGGHTGSGENSMIILRLTV